MSEAPDIRCQIKKKMKKKKEKEKVKSYGVQNSL
jgi:hypothetical protein